MFSFLAIVVTLLVLGSALLWRAARRRLRSRAEAAIGQRVVRNRASSTDALSSSRASMTAARKRRPGMP